MTDQAYSFSRWVYGLMESFFDWVWSLISSGSLDYFFRHWFAIALLLSVAAYVIDKLLYYLINGKETLLVKGVLCLAQLPQRVPVLIKRLKGEPVDPPGAGYEAYPPDEEENTFEDEPTTLEIKPAAMPDRREEPVTIAPSEPALGEYAFITAKKTDARGEEAPADTQTATDGESKSNGVKRSV